MTLKPNIMTCAEYNVPRTVIEAGFASDLGAEMLFHILFQSG